ncbi:MAG: hypothetical protein GWO24_32415, partial [Akkermansiaceae bacterium]|nr:hypothetical protein [Akkermansiaceae bacterium]
GIARVSSAVTTNGEVVDLADILLDEDDPAVESVLPPDSASEVSVIDDVLITFT